MNGADDLPASVRDALARSDDLDERERLLDQLCAQTEAAGDPAVAAWAAVEGARCAYHHASYTRAVAWCDRALAGDPPPAANAAATVIRVLAGMLDGTGHVPDGATLARAAEILAANGMWEDATSAHAYLAREADARGDLASARREYARAIGCAEAGCGRRIGPGYLLALARMETRLGHPRRAIGHLGLPDNVAWQMLDENVLGRYDAHLRRIGRFKHASGRYFSFSAGPRQFLKYLRSIGIAPPPRVELSPLVEEFAGWPRRRRAGDPFVPCLPVVPLSEALYACAVVAV